MLCRYHLEGQRHKLSGCQFERSRERFSINVLELTLWPRLDFARRDIF